MPYNSIGNLGKCLQYVRIDFYRKKPEKQAKNDAFHAILVIKGGGKPLITTNKLAGPVGGLGPPHPPSHYRNLSKRVSNITFMHRGTLRVPQSTSGRAGS